MARRIRDPEVIDGINDPSPEKLTPDAVGDCLGEEGIGRIEHPVSQRAPRIHGILRPSRAGHPAAVASSLHL